MIVASVVPKRHEGSLVDDPVGLSRLTPPVVSERSDSPLHVWLKVYVYHLMDNRLWC
jgi:hypothetical protein